MELRRYVEIILKRKSVLLLALVLTPFSALVFSLCVKPVYRSEAKLWITMDPLQQAFLKDMPVSYGKLNFMEVDNALGSIEEILESESVAGAVISELGLKNSRGELLKRDDFVDAGFFSLLRQKKGVAIEKITDSEVFNITGYSDNPAEAAKIAELTISRFKAAISAIYREATVSASQALTRRLSIVNASLVEANRLMAEYKRDNALMDVSVQLNSLVSELANLRYDLAKTERQLLSDKNSLRAVKEALAAQPEFKDHQTTLERNPVIAEAKKQLLSLEINLAKLLQELTPEHPEVKATLGQIEETKKVLKSEVERVFSAHVSQRNTYHDTLMTRYGDTEINIVSGSALSVRIRDEVSAKEREIKDLADKEEKLNSLRRSVDDFNTSYNNVRQALEMALNARELDLANAVTVQRAAISSNLKDNQYLPPAKRTVFLLVSLLVGGFIGLGAVFTLEYVDDTIHTAEDARNVTKLALAFSLPFVERGAVSADDLSRPSRFLDTVRNILGSVRVVNGERAVKPLSVISLDRRDGRSSVAATMAMSLAAEGKKTLLIDADMRNPSLHTLFKTANNLGLAGYIEGKTSAEQSVIQTRVNNLWLMPTGSSAGTAVPLTPERMEALLNEAVRNYDAVIVDTPPLEAGAEGLMASKSAVFIFSEGKSRRRAASDYFELAKTAGINIVGALVNRRKPGLTRIWT